MIKALIAVGAILGAFAAGLAGVYFAMPALSPETVERVQTHLDSLAVADSLIALGISPDSLAIVLADSAATAQADSLAMASSDSLADAGGEPSGSDSSQTALEGAATIQDSLMTLQQSVEGLLKEKARLLDQIKALQARVQTQQSQEAEAQGLSATLAKLEDKELAGVVEQLDMAVLQILYKQASARNRTRLLQAMPPPVAATFVQSLVQPGRAAATTPPDTTSRTPAAGSEPLP